MRCSQRGGGAYRRSAQRITAAQSSFIEQWAGLKRPVESDRRSLLLGTALASTLLMGTLAAPTPAAALTCAVYVGTGPAPISLLNTNDSIICVNTEARANAAGNAIELGTYNADHSISLNSSGALTASNGASAFGIFATTDGTNSPIDVVNSGDIWTRVTSGYAIGVGAISNSSDSPIGIDNSGDITARSAAVAAGIFGITTAGDSPINIVNSGDLSIDAGQDGMGIRSQASGGSATVTNTGKIAVSSGNHAFGIFSQAASMTSIVNSGDLTVSAGVNAAVGILGQTYGPGGSISIKNSGNISVSSPERYAGGLVGITQRDDSSVSITNSGNITATDARLIAAGIYASTIGANSSIRSRTAAPSRQPARATRSAFLRRPMAPTALSASSIPDRSMAQMRASMPRAQPASSSPTPAASRVAWGLPSSLSPEALKSGTPVTSPVTWPSMPKTGSSITRVPCSRRGRHPTSIPTGGRRRPVHQPVRRHGPYGE